MHDHDPGVAGSQWWVVPGGGLDPDEDWATAAVREVAEETGVTLMGDQLRGPVAHRLVVHGYSDRVLTQEEMFFVADLTDAQAASAGGTSGFTEREKHTLLGHGWFTVDDLAGLVTWPTDLAHLAGLDGSTCLELGTVEESTVPAD